jgi:hypothetical protein
MWWASGFYGYFSVLLIGQTATAAGVDAFATSVGVVGSGPGGYALWVGYALVQAYAVIRSVGAKRAAAGTVAALADR